MQAGATHEYGWQGDCPYGRYLRNTSQCRGQGCVVHNSDRRRVSDPPMDSICGHHVFAPCMAALALGTGYELAVRPKRLVLGNRRFQAAPVGAGLDCSLANALGTAIAEANAWAVNPAFAVPASDDLPGTLLESGDGEQLGYAIWPRKLNKDMLAITRSSQSA